MSKSTSVADVGDRGPCASLASRISLSSAVVGSKERAGIFSIDDDDGDDAEATERRGPVGCGASSENEPDDTRRFGAPWAVSADDKAEAADADAEGRRGGDVVELETRRTGATLWSVVRSSPMASRRDADAFRSG